MKGVGCVRVFTETISGTKAQRKGWEEMMAYIRSGDVLVVTELSRMSRSLSHLLEIVEEFNGRQVGLKSLRENIDTSSATGRAFLSIMGAVSQMELEIKSEKAEAGRAAAKARGKSGGRPATDPDKLEQARILYQHSGKSAREGFSLFEYLRKIKQNMDIKG